MRLRLTPFPPLPKPTSLRNALYLLEFRFWCALRAPFPTWSRKQVAFINAHVFAHRLWCRCAHPGTESCRSRCLSLEPMRLRVGQVFHWPAPMVGRSVTPVWTGDKYVIREDGSPFPA